MKPWGWKVWEDALKIALKKPRRWLWKWLEEARPEECLRMTLEETRMIRHYEEWTIHNEGDIQTSKKCWRKVASITKSNLSKAESSNDWWSLRPGRGGVRGASRRGTCPPWPCPKFSFFMYQNFMFISYFTLLIFFKVQNLLKKIIKNKLK